LNGKYNFATLLEVVGDEGKKVFKYEDDIYRMLSAIDGCEKNENVLELLDLKEIKKGNMCKNIVMVLQSKDSCDAMESFLKKYKKDVTDSEGNVIKKAFGNLSKYKIINIAGNSTNLDTSVAKKLINAEVERGNKTISLTVDKMLTGVTVKAWDTMFYMKDETAPQGYDQARFRIQSPYVKEVPELEVGDDLTTVYDTDEKQKIAFNSCLMIIDKLIESEEHE
jgi:phosphoribosylformylglycinamidine (FGAM) synthase PurS component